MVSGYSKFLSLVVLATTLAACSTSNHKGVMGSKGRASKSFAKRHQSREYQEAKVKEQKTEVGIQEAKPTDIKNTYIPSYGSNCCNSHRRCCRPKSTAGCSYCSCSNNK